MAGKLIICPTPIGNLGDMTERALAALRAAADEERFFAVAIPLSGIAGRDAYEQLTQGGNAHGQTV